MNEKHRQQRPQIEHQQRKIVDEQIESDKISNTLSKRSSTNINVSFVFGNNLPQPQSIPSILIAFFLHCFFTTITILLLSVEPVDLASQLKVKLKTKKWSFFA